MRAAPRFEPLAAAEAHCVGPRVVRAGAAVWAATLVLWAFFLFVIASKLGQKDATVAEKKAAQRDRRRRTCVRFSRSLCAALLVLLSSTFSASATNAALF